MRAVLAMVILACAMPAVAQDARIAGTVVSADSGAPLAGVTVRVGGVSAVTDARGGYSLAAPRADHYTITFAEAGYYDARQVFARHELGDIAPVALVSRKPGRALFVFGGDVMAGRRYETPLEGERQLIRPGSRLADTQALLAEMTPDLAAADLASVNLEITLSAAPLTEAADKAYVFYADPALATALKGAGVDYVSLGNNHTYDYLEPGLSATIAAVDAAGLGHSGAGLDEAAAAKPWRTEIAGRPWSVLGFVGWKGPGTPNQVAEAGKGGAALGTTEAIRAGIGAESATGRATILQYHGSSEYSDGPTDITAERMTAAVEAGADLVIGHHPHVIQGFAFHDGKLVVHSLGNFLFDQYFLETHPSMLLRVWMDGEDFHRAEIVPLHIRDYRPVPAIGGMRQAVLQRVRALSAASGVEIGLSGGHGWIAPPGTPVTAIPAAAAGERLWRGDFESFTGFGAEDRTWKIEGGSIAATRAARNGGFALQLTPAKGAGRMTLSQKIAFRKPAAGPLQIAGAVRAEGAVRLGVEIRYRAAAKDAPPDRWQRIGEVAAPAGTWTSFAFDSQPPAEPNRGFSSRFVAAGEGGALSPMLLDDVTLVERAAQD